MDVPCVVLSELDWFLPKDGESSVVLEVARFGGVVSIGELLDSVIDAVPVDVRAFVDTFGEQNDADAMIRVQLAMPARCIMYITKRSIESRERLREWGLHSF